MSEGIGEIPRIDDQNGTAPSGADRDVFEFRLLAADAKASENRIRDDHQRFWLRNIAIVVVILAIAGMACFLRGLPRGSHVAVYIAPIVSISTLTIALLISAFRGWKDNDEKLGTSIASDAVKASKFLPN